MSFTSIIGNWGVFTFTGGYLELSHVCDDKNEDFSSNTDQDGYCRSCSKLIPREVADAALLVFPRLSSGTYPGLYEDK